MQGFGGALLHSLCPPPPPAPTAGPALLSPSSGKHQMWMRETGRPPQAGLPNWLFLRDLKGFPRQVNKDTPGSKFSNCPLPRSSPST